jgi:hypothetical protein
VTGRTGQLGAEATVAGGVARIVTGPPELGQAIEFFEDASGPAGGAQGASGVPQRITVPWRLPAGAGGGKLSGSVGTVEAASDRTLAWSNDAGRHQWHLALYLRDFVGSYQRFEVRWSVRVTCTGAA